MTLLRTAGLVLSWGVAVVWVARSVQWLHGMRRLPDLLEQPRCRPRGRLSVIVPARDEAVTVEAGLRSLLGSKDVDLEVIAVDDRSADGTGAILDAIADELAVEPEAAATAVRYRVEHVRQLPPGWLGKPHAMARGAELATGEWLLFTDADVVFRKDALARALDFAEREKADHLLVLPTLVSGTAGEEMMLAFLYVMSIWGPRLWRVADPQARDCAGVGAFHLLRRSAYEQVGGWESARMEVIEDVRMGYLIKRAGLRSRVATGQNLVRIRWARGAWGVVTNLTKNIFAAFRFRLGRFTIALMGVPVMCLLPFAALAIGIRGDRAWLWPGLAVFAVVVALHWRYRRSAVPGGVRVLVWAPCFPVATLVMLTAMLRSAVLTLARGGVVWRDTFYPLGELRAHAGPLH